MLRNIFCSKIKPTAASVEKTQMHLEYNWRDDKSEMLFGWLLHCIQMYGHTHICVLVYENCFKLNWVDLFIKYSWFSIKFQYISGLHKSIRTCFLTLEIATLWSIYNVQFEHIQSVIDKECVTVNWKFTIFVFILKLGVDCNTYGSGGVWAARNIAMQCGKVGRILVY